MKNENGRSMIEMLGVLAIIGVLSVGGIYGYTVAMRKYKANEIVQTASMLATMAHSANAGQGTGDTALTLANSGLNQTPGGVSVSMSATTADGLATVAITNAGSTEMCTAITSIAPTSGSTQAIKDAAGYIVTCAS